MSVIFPALNPDFANTQDFASARRSINATPNPISSNAKQGSQSLVSLAIDLSEQRVQQ